MVTQITGPGTTALLTAPLVVPLVVAGLAAAFGWHRWIGRAQVLAAATVLAVGVTAAVRVTGSAPLAAGSVLRADALSAVMLIIIGAVGIVATWAGIAYISDDLALGRCSPRAAHRYASLLPVFLAAMALAVLAANLGLMWAAVEATTVATAFLVGHNRTRAGLEATWKYVIICSVGIALAYLGTVLVYFASREAGGGEGTLDWVRLAEDPHALDPAVMRLAFALLVLGFGAKAGLIPLHSWLPDAHGQAPAPVSALMSGVLLPVAMYALLRYRVIAAGVDPEFTRRLLLTVGIVSLALAVSLLLAQRDYKRMLAYSSIEHMGLAAIGVAVATPLTVAAVLLHLLGHGLGKAVLFCGSGQLLHTEGTTSLSGLRSLLVRRPALAATVALGLAALLGLPPFSLFASELALVRGLASADHQWVLAPIAALLLVAFAAVAVRAAAVLLGAPVGDRSSTGPSGVTVRAGTRAGVAPLVVGLAALAMLGVLTWPLSDLLTNAAAIGAGT